MTSFLDDLLDSTRARVAAAREVEPLGALRERALATPPPPSFGEALAQPDVAVIAEVKRASPSKGDLAPHLDAATQARAYLEGGASAVSVLTEPSRFRGSLEDLCAVAALGAPTLRKDFLVDPYQVWEARVAGAAAVLLIVAAVGRDDLALLADTTRAAGLDALVEVHADEELETAVAVGADAIGVNARNLRTFALDRGAFARLRPQFPDGVLAVAESGIAVPADVHEAAVAGADAVLVGEALVRAADPGRQVAGLVAAGKDRVPESPLRRSR